VRHRLRRFAVVGTVATAVDIGILLALRLGPGVPVVVADAVSVAVAAVVSYALHRAVTFADDPERRWVHATRLFVAVTLAAAVVDILVLRAAVAVVGSTTWRELVVGKAISLYVAGLVRAAAYRRRLFLDVRATQSAPRPRPLPDSAVRLSVVIPAYREAGRIGETIAAVRAALADVGPVEIVVVDDGSGDATATDARAGGADIVIVQPQNRGKGAAVRAGMLAATGRVAAFTDADLSYPPEQLTTLLANVEDGWDMVVGSRKHVGTTTLVRARRLREVTGRVFNLLSEVVLLGQYRDTQCGLKAFRGDVARSLFSRTRVDRFAFDVELFHLAERDRLSVLEVPVSLANPTVSTIRVGADSLRMVRDLFRIRRWGGQGAYDAPGELSRYV
jgi:putative flippase GtrA